MADDELVGSFLRTVLGGLRRSKAMRREEILEWHSKGVLSTMDVAADRDALTKTLVSTMADRIRLPLKLSRFC